MIAKVTGPEMKRFLKLRHDFYKLFPYYNPIQTYWKSIEQAFKDLKWLNSVASAHAPHSEDIDKFESRALQFLNLLKTEFFAEMEFKDYEHLLIKHVPIILKKHGSCGKFSTQGFEHKNKISKQDFHQSSSKGGGLTEKACNYTLQMINYDVVRLLLHFHSEVAEPMPDSTGKYIFTNLLFSYS